MTYRKTILPRAREAFGRWPITHCARVPTFVNLNKYGVNAGSSTFHDLDEAAEDAVALGSDYLGTVVWNGETFMADLTEHGEVLQAEAEQDAEDERAHEMALRSWYHGHAL